MRLEAQKRLGYYPAHPRAITELVKHLHPRGPDPTKKYDSINVLDPCCGKGDAIRQIADSLGITHDHVFTIELDPERGKAVQELMPRAHHISPASFIGCQITGHSFSLAYVNPPFDFELGGGRREELSFCQSATPLLVTHGILVLICPITALCGSGTFVDFLDANYEDICVYRFPDGEDDEGKEIRQYKEIAVIGRKRREILPRDSAEDHGCLNKMNMKWRNYFQIELLPPLGTVQPESWSRGAPSYSREPMVRVWELPHSWRPHTWKKNAFTEEEFNEAVETSPLNRHFHDQPPIEVAESPLALDRGHLGLILASGVLDGRVQGPHGTHVVRGSSYKKQVKDHEATVSTENVDTGAITTKETLRERLITCIRVAIDYPTPQICTFSNDDKQEKKEEHVDADFDED